MKKRVVWTILLMTAFIALKAKAATYGPDAWGQTWTYEEKEDGFVMLTGIADKTLPYDAANFPWTFTNGGNTYKVIKIASNVCQGWTALTGNLEVPPFVQIISNYAFSGCENLTSVRFSEGIQSLGTHTFESGCKTASKPFALIIPSSVDTLERQMFQWGGCNISAAWYKGKPTVALGTQTYTLISIYRTIFADPSCLTTVLIGKNTDAMPAAGKDNIFLYDGGSWDGGTKNCTVFAPDRATWRATNFGGTGTKVFFYGPGCDLDLEIDEAAGQLKATVKTGAAFAAVVKSAATFRTDFGLTTHITVTDSLEFSAEDMITAEQMAQVTLDMLMFKASNQEQLDRVLAALPARVPVAIDPAEATENMVVSTSDGRKVYFLLPENGTYQLRKDKLIILVR